MNYLLSRLQKMHKKAFLMLRMGLETVIACCAVLVVYINRASGLVEYALLREALMSIAVSLAIVIGGSAAFDKAIDEYGGKD